MFKKKEVDRAENKKIEKTPEEIQREKFVKKRKTYRRTAVMWILVIILGIVYYKVDSRSKTTEIVFTRTEETPKDLNDKIYIFYPQNSNIENMEIVIPKVNDQDELLTATITEVIKKMQSDNIVPEIDLKDVSYYLTDNKIYIDLPERIFENVRDARTELLIIYSFVNTLTSINGIESVRFLINNADLEKVKYANLMRDFTYRKTI